MAYEMISSPLLRIPSVWQEDEDLVSSASNMGGVSVSEDDKNVFVEASLPGINPQDVEITLNKGILWIKGEKQDEQSGRKYYQKSLNTYSYRILVPADLDLSKEPLAEMQNGVMTITFAKSGNSSPEKIQIKAKAKNK